MPGNEESFNEATFDAIDGGLIVFGTDVRIVRWNKWMATTSNRPEADALGKTLPELFPAADLKRLPSAIKTALGSSASTVLTNALNPSLLPLHNRSGRPLLHDITVSPVGLAPASGCVVFV